MVFAGRREPPTDLDAGGHAKGPVLWGRGWRAERRGEDEKAVGVVCHQGKMEEEPAAAPWSQVREDLRTAHGRPGGQAGQRMTGMREAPRAHTGSRQQPEWVPREPKGTQGRLLTRTA